jgi:polysaccharide deacetylase 2 family uncharacterized protein YibQ
MAKGMQRHGGWRWLGLFWASVLVILLAGAGTLAWLGPPPKDAAPPPAEAATPMAEAPPAEPIPAAPNPPAASLPALAPVVAGPHVEPALVEPSTVGPLPRVAPDGRSPMQAYARPFDPREARPRLALVVGGLGLNASLTEQAIAALPPTTGLAFSPYAPRARPLIEQARARGFETLLALPLEPQGYPLNDPGDRALLTGLPPGENLARLDWLLARFPGHVGAIGALGSMRGERYAMLAEPYEAMQAVLARRGLLFLEARPGAPPPARAFGRSIDLVVDEPATRAEIDARLLALERLARERGSALGYVGEASPVAVARIAAWAAEATGRGIVLAPPSALVRPPR